MQRVIFDSIQNINKNGTKIQCQLQSIARGVTGLHGIPVRYPVDPAALKKGGGVSVWPQIMAVVPVLEMRQRSNHATTSLVIYDCIHNMKKFLVPFLRHVYSY